MTIPRKNRLLALACAGLMLAATASPAAAAVAAPARTATATTASDLGRGDIVSADLLASLSPRQVEEYLGQAKFPVPSQVQGVDLYAVVYRTVGVTGGRTTASGVVALPHDARDELWMVSYGHGTMATKRYAGSVADGDGRAVPVMFAATGFAAVAPDYLGLGKGPGFHPYMDTATEASASVDLLRAARELAAAKDHTLSGDVLVTGFSQGGQATMALGRELQRDRSLGFRLRGLAPIAGPYDVRGAEMPELLAGRLDPHSSTFYLAYWTVSMNRLHGFYRTPAQAFRDPAVERLFDGHHDFDEIVAGLPASPRELVTPAFWKRLQRPSGSLAKALDVNDTTCSDWRPEVPVRLFAGRGDRDVTILNSRNCLRDLRAGGATASLTDVGDVDHQTSAFRSFPIVLRWFEQLR